MEYTRARRWWLRIGEVESSDFAPRIVAAQNRPPSPLARLVLHLLLGLFGVALLWAGFGRLDIVAVAQGKLVPQSFLKIVQPAEPGIVREILVKEGEAVSEGQVLIRMDTRLSEADARALKAELDRRRLQLRRIEAELAGRSLERAPEDPPALYAQTEALLEARRRAYLDALGAEQATLARARHDLESALEVEDKLKKTLPIYKDQADSWDRLAREGFAGRLLALERRRAFLEAEQDLRAHAKVVAGLKALIAQSERRIAQIASNYRRELASERAEAEAAHHKLAQDWDKLQHRRELLELRAPQAGVVKDLATHTPGTVVAAGTILLTLVPHEGPLVAEVWVSNADAGFVQENQKARVKLAAYPFQKYGVLEGVVRQIGADAQEKQDASPGAGGEPKQSAYRALVVLERDHLQSAGRRLPLRPGMQVSAEIHLGTRTVLEYLVSPVRKIVHEAGRER
ncbi:MAG TPA: HlyD family type I secretion periplasmic adaptor subunit [Burkholderiales bacterium]|nr:HlyD family type I secretion periplasmic adaptor subunit [Burkholderiales bacterium]